MSKYHYIRLTFAVHKVIELFPKKEALGHELSNLANEILINLINEDKDRACRNIAFINSLFNQVQGRNWVDPRNFLILRREYDKIAQFIQTKGISSGKPVEKSFQNKNRKKLILGILKENGKIKVGDLAKTFPTTNRRTLLRDLDSFCQNGLVEKNGNGRGVCYLLRNTTL